VVEFYTAHPTPATAWRLAVLMGANTRTYKFALGSALLELAAAGRTDVTLEDLAQPYALTLVQHAVEMPQARPTSELGETDFLSIAAAEADETLRTGVVTEKLQDAAVQSMPGMVMQKFHNLAGGTEVPHRFYELKGSGRHRVVELTPALRTAAAAADSGHLGEELQARWRIVETSFSAQIGASLIADGVGVDTSSMVLTDKRRRRSVAGVTDAVIGFQHDRCLICNEVMSTTDVIAVDHVFPYSLMTRGMTSAESGPDLDSVWNLAPAHARCNGDKSNRMPSQAEVERLARRNIAIMGSPHPLRRTLELTLKRHGYAGRADDWYAFLRSLLA
jgi:hypothetical protein